MSKSVQLENAITNAAKPGDYLPNNLPDWMQGLGILPGDLITTITTIDSLMLLGEFRQVEPDRLNHNHILKTLEQDYNIFIFIKQNYLAIENSN